MTLFAIAYRLHQPMEVIASLDFEELRDWVAYFRIVEKEKD